MPSFIRTECGRIAETKDNMTIKSNRLVYKDRPCIAVLQGCDEIIAQADTIEELCDEFVVIEESQNYVMEIVSSYKALKDNGWIGSNLTIYGAIWTDKGLIYVAKMNENGDLELI